MAIGNDGAIYITYIDDRTQLDFVQKVMFTKKEPGSEWTTPIIVDTCGGFEQRNNHVSDIAVSDNGDVHIAYLTWAYENFRDILGYIRYNAGTDEWTVDTISEAGGSIETWDQIYIHSNNQNNPYVAWGRDDRTGIEEVYMKYHNGTEWSPDILVSKEDENPTRNVFMEKLSENLSIIMFWEELDGSDNIELRYRLYNELDYSLSELKSVPGTQINTNVYRNNASIAYKNNSHALLAIWYHEYPVEGFASDTTKCFDYDIANDVFIESPHIRAYAQGGNVYPKMLDVVSDFNGNTGILMNHNYYNRALFCPFDSVSGFGTFDMVSTSANMTVGSYIDAEIDNDNNIHVVFADERYDSNNDGYIDRDVFYRSGDIITSIDNTFKTASPKIYPNPCDDYLYVDIQDINRIEILDVSGKTLQVIHGNNSRIRTTGLPEGIYFCKVFSNNEISTHKLLKK
jgi:hypothetical protein